MSAWWLLWGCVVLVLVWGAWFALRDDEPSPPAESEWVYDGPDSLLLLENLDAYLDAYFASLAHLFEELGPPPTDPAGCDRLRDAIRQQGEDEQP